MGQTSSLLSATFVERMSNETCLSPREVRMAYLRFRSFAENKEQDFRAVPIPTKRIVMKELAHHPLKERIIDVAAGFGAMI